MCGKLERHLLYCLRVYLVPIFDVSEYQHEYLRLLWLRTVPGRICPKQTTTVDDDTEMISFCQWIQVWPALNIWPDFVGCLFIARDAKTINWKKLGHLIIILIEMIFNIFNRKKIEDKCIISWLSSTSFCKLFIYFLLLQVFT